MMVTPNYKLVYNPRREKLCGAGTSPEACCVVYQRNAWKNPWKNHEKNHGQCDKLHILIINHPQDHQNKVVETIPK